MSGEVLHTQCDTFHQNDEVNKLSILLSNLILLFDLDSVCSTFNTESHEDAFHIEFLINFTVHNLF